MKIAALLLAGIVAVEHVLILVLEMFLWQTEIGMKVFKLTPETAAITATLAKNQGLYNGFLAAGLFWALFFIKDASQKYQTIVFFLVCIVIAAIFGSATAKFSIIFTQGGPAILALIFTLLANKK
jgi:putative membrane protein